MDLEKLSLSEEVSAKAETFIAEHPALCDDEEGGKLCFIAGWLRALESLHDRAASEVVDCNNPKDEMQAAAVEFLEANKKMYITGPVPYGRVAFYSGWVARAESKSAAQFVRLLCLCSFMMGVAIMPLLIVFLEHWGKR